MARGPPGTRANALACWLLLVAVAAVTGWLALDGQLAWAGFGVAVIAVTAIPAATFRDPSIVPPWWLVALAALPLFGLATAAFRGLPAPATTAVTSLSVATLALLVAVHLHDLTRVDFSPRFAVVFVVATTMAVAAAWTILRWLVDTLLGTDGLGSVPAIMQDLFVATVTGVVAGLAFVGYVDRVADGSLDGLEGSP